MTGFWVLDCLCLAVVLVCAVLVAKLRNLNGAVMSPVGDPPVAPA